MSDFTFTFTLSCIREGNGNPLQYSCLENPWMEEPGRLQSMGSLRVGHDFTFTFTLTPTLFLDEYQVPQRLRNKL